MTLPWRILLLVLLAGFIAGCDGSDEPTPNVEGTVAPDFESTVAAGIQATVIAAAIEATQKAQLVPSPTPDVEATVMAMVATQIAGLPTPKPLYWPTIEDYKIIVLRKTGGFGYNNTYLLEYDQYAATYVASECIAGMQLSPQGFRSFVDQTFLMQYANGTAAIAVTAESVISELIRLAELPKLGVSPVDRDCIRPYMYPESGTEIVLTAGLLEALMKARMGGFAYNSLIASGGSVQSHQ